VSTLIAFLVVDGLIILSFGARLCKDTLKDVIADSFVLFYLLFAFGICYFANVRRRRMTAGCGRPRCGAHSTACAPTLTYYADTGLGAAACPHGSPRGTMVASAVAAAAYLILTRF
jgi:hypothetical protein